MNRTPGSLQEQALWHSPKQKFLIIQKMSLNVFIQKQTFLFISSALTHHGSVPFWIQNHAPSKSLQRVLEFLRFQESEDYQQHEGVTQHLINMTPISGQRCRCRLKTVSTSQISSKKLYTLPLGRSLIPTISPFIACGG